MPEAPPMSSRPVLVDRDYSIYDVLLRDDVTLETKAIRRVTATVSRWRTAPASTSTSSCWPRVSRPTTSSGPWTSGAATSCSGGDLWAKDGARAYVGSMLPGFPNFFILYGPNTNQLSGLQIVAMEEIVTRFALGTIGGLIEQGKRRSRSPRTPIGGTTP